MSNRAAFIESERGKIIVRDTEIAELEEREILVKVHACALQPGDAMVAKLAIVPVDYPAVLGVPIAGIVEAIGPGVTKVRVGDRIFCATKILSHKKAKYGGLQRYSIVDAAQAVLIGDTDFVKATTLASYTPPGALFATSTLNMHWPTIPATPLPASERGKKILIWGGSSAMGSLSISYAKHAGYTVVSTASPHNFDKLQACGADHIFDHSDPATMDKIRSLFPIHYWFDTIAQRSSVTSILQILAPEGKPVTKAHILLLVPPAISGVKGFPEGITAQFHQFSPLASENKEWLKHFLARGGFMEKAIKEGVIKGVPAEILGGLENVEEGIERLHRGVSGRKLVIEPWA